MAVAGYPVVKLEDVEEDGRSTTSEDLAALVRPDRESSSPLPRQSTKSAKTKTTLSLPDLDIGTEQDGRDTSLSEDGTLVEYIPSEARELLRPYPEGWPKLPVVLEGRDYTNAQTPAVNLASAHLELLQNIIDEWFRTNSASASQSMSRFSHRDQSVVSSRRHLKFDPAPEPVDLSLTGVGGKADLEKQRSSHVVIEEPDSDLPYLGAEEVVEEVINLLAKLENDRREIYREYKSERDKVKRLAARIDALAERRLDMMPAAVQHEHEACARDIYELQWHISYRGRIRDRTVNRREVAEALHQRLQEEIDHLLSQSPMIREKLDLESEIMEKINAAQKETDAELKKTVDKCQKLQAKSDDTHQKAEQERQYMKDEIISLNKDYQKISTELERVRAQYEKFLEKIATTAQDIAKIEEDTKVMIERHGEAEKEQAASTQRVSAVKSKIYQEEKQQKDLVDEMIKKQKKIEARKKAQNTVEAKLAKNIDQLDGEYQFVHRIAQEFDLDIEDFARRTLECEKQTKENEKRIESIKSSLASTGEELNTITKEYNRVEAIHNAVSSRLAAETIKAKKTEEQLRTALAGLKKQVNDEKNARAMLESNIASDKVELAKSEEEGAVKKGKLEKLAKELQKAVDEILGKVEVLRASREETDTNLANLRQHLADVREEHERVTTELTNRKNELIPQEQKLKEENVSLEKKIDHLDWRSEMMKKKMEDMSASSIMMNRAVSNTEKAIKDLTADLDEVNLRYEAAQKSLAALKDLLSDTTERNRRYASEHALLMGERGQVLEQYQKELEENHRSNSQLAATYRRLDNECMVLKDKLLNEMEESLQLENTLKDTKQLQSLQTKMHSALCEYFKHRGLYMQSELQAMDTASYANTKRIRKLYNDINGAMDVTSEFLSTAWDQTKARRMAEEAVLKQEQAEQAALQASA